MEGQNLYFDHLKYSAVAESKMFMWNGWVDDGGTKRELENYDVYTSGNYF